MFRIFAFISVVVATSLFSACSSSSSDKVVDLPPDRNKNATCFPESTFTGIVGGQRVNPNDIDSKKVMMLNIVKDDGLSICTAAAIAPNVLLTAGHCVTGPAEKAFVTLYTSLSCESGFDARVNAVKVSEFVVNEKFNLQMSEDHVENVEGDLALIFLKETLPAGYPIYKIAQPEHLSVAEPIYFYGYGSTRYGNDPKHANGATILRKTQLPGSAVTLDVISKKVRIDQSNGTGICTGDSGGPGLTKIDGELEILGVNSYIDGTGQVEKCGGKSVLVLADSYRSWIESKMNARGASLRH